MPTLNLAIKVVFTNISEVVFRHMVRQIEPIMNDYFPHTVVCYTLENVIVITDTEHEGILLERPLITISGTKLASVARDMLVEEVEQSIPVTVVVS